MSANPESLSTHLEPVPPALLASRVTAIRPRLAAAAQAAERQRAVPAGSVQAMREAGLLRAFRPRRHGGLELHMRDVLPLVAELAEACPASAWVLAVLQIHEWLLGLFPEATQAEVFAAGQPVGGVLQPRGQAVPAADGWELGPGTWPFASGIDHAGWALVGALHMREDGPPDSLLLLLAPDQYDIVDDWHVSGLRATGSRQIRVAAPVQVPGRRVLDFGARLGRAIDVAEPATLRAAILPVLSLNVTGPALGAARQALQLFAAHVADRRMPFSPQSQAGNAVTQRALGEAATRVDVAALLLARAADGVAEAAEAGRAMDVGERCRVRADCAWAVRECVTAVESLWRLGGGGLLQEAHPLNRCLRDVQAMQQHAALNLDNNLELYGAATLGQPLNSSFV